MMKWRIGIVIVGLLLASPIIYLNYWGLKMSAWTGEAIEQAEAVAEAHQSGQPVPKVTLAPMPKSPLDWLRERGEMRRMESGDFNGERVVEISYKVPFEAFMGPGEDMPEPVFRPVYAEARAPQLSMIYCPELLATLATGCVVQGTDVKYRADDDEVEVRATLAYLPDYQIGERPSGAEPVEVLVILTTEGDRSSVPTFTSADRRYYLDKAERLCAQIRDEFGTCVVKNLSLAALHRVEAAADGQAKLHARARIAVMAPDGQVNAEALDARARELSETPL